jgi:hypothetical protein
VIVVTANQAPTLMNILEQSSSWKLRWVPTADHEGVSEMKLMRVPRYDPSDSPVAALVCAPHQIDIMRTRFPRAKVVWVAHNGYVRPENHMFSRVDACLAFSERVASLHEASTGVKTYFISPWYVPLQSWKWAPNLFVTIRSRPSHRIDDTPSVAAFALKGLRHVLYGQDQAGGFIDGEKKYGVLSSCSAYGSFLHRCAGFGLAEHEAMSVGAPILGSFWGDMEREARLYSLEHSIDRLPMLAKILAEDESFAKICSQQSLDYIAERRTKERMDRSITMFLDAMA